MSPSHLPPDNLGKLVHVIEECAEVQKAITKLIRFGAEEHHPDDPKKVPNALAVLVEIEDLKTAISRIAPWLREVSEACGWERAP